MIASSYCVGEISRRRLSQTRHVQPVNDSTRGVVSENDNAQTAMAGSSEHVQPYPFVEHLWIVRKDHQSVAMDLYRDRGGWELRFLSDGCWFASEASGSRELAITYANLIRQDLLSDGWHS